MEPVIATRYHYPGEETREQDEELVEQCQEPSPWGTSSLPPPPVGYCPIPWGAGSDWLGLDSPSSHQRQGHGVYPEPDQGDLSPQHESADDERHQVGFHGKTLVAEATFPSKHRQMLTSSVHTGQCRASCNLQYKNMLDVSFFFLLKRINLKLL